MLLFFYRYEAFPAGIYVALKEEGSLLHASFVPGPDYNIYEKPWYTDRLNSEDFVFGSVYFDEDSQGDKMYPYVQSLLESDTTVI